MRFTFAHNNINVHDLAKSLAFYGEALGLQEVRRIAGPDGAFTIVFLGDGKTAHQLELTHMTARQERYNLGDNEFHLALHVDDYPAAHQKHSAMGCICYENPTMGIYFIADPDGYWVEILPAR
jgi:lactoylglutathione lyase